jgi:molybdate transport system substrate-binding protein
MTPRRAAAVALLPLLLCGLPAAAAPGATPSAPQPAPLRVFAAASLSEAFGEIGGMLERQRPGLVVRFNFAGSQQLAAQIEQGAAADVFASADERWMKYASERGLLTGDPLVFARNRLVVIVPKTNPARIHRLQDLARGGVKLVIGADAVPVGRYGRIAIRNLARDSAFGDEFATRTLRNVVSEEENVKAVVAKVQLGEADAGIVYRSDVTPAVSRYIRVFEIPGSANVVASYPIALVRGARSSDAAAAFLALVRSPEGQQALERHGLMVAEAPGP